MYFFPAKRASDAFPERSENIPGSDNFFYAPSQIFVHTYDKVIVTPLNKSSKNMVNSAEPGFKSAKNDLFVLTHCDYLKCTFQG